MSSRSLPFELGIPVLDDPDVMAPDNFILRARTEADCWKKLEKFLSYFEPTTRIKFYRIGFRPDHPIPTAMYFYEINVDRNPSPYDKGIGWHFYAYGTKTRSNREGNRVFDRKGGTEA